LVGLLPHGHGPRFEREHGVLGAALDDVYDNLVEFGYFLLDCSVLGPLLVLHHFVVHLLVVQMHFMLGTHDRVAEA